MLTRSKLSLIFVGLALVLVFLTFYIKNYLSIAKSDHQTLDMFNPKSFFTSDKKFINYEEDLQILDLVEGAKSETIVFHFWASWCEPCINEIPDFLDYVESEVKSGSNTKMIAVSMDENRDDLKRFLKNFPKLNQSPLVRIWDRDGAIREALKIEKLPATLFIESSGKIKLVNGVVDWHRLIAIPK